MRALMTGLTAALAGSLALLASASPAAASEPAEHVVRAGDNLHLIAGYYYRDPRQWRKLWKLNQKDVPRPSQLVPGRALRVEVTPGVTWDIPYEEFRAKVRGQ